MSDGPNVGGGFDFEQKERTAELVTPLGRDELVLTRFDGTESLSELFVYQIEATSNRQDIDFDKLIGKNCCVKLKSYGNATRYFNGVLVDADWSGAKNNLYAYRLVLRPWLWLLGRKATCRIFKDKSVFDIIEEVFQESGFKDFQIRASRGDYEKIEYCVQYRESDLSFVSRLLEEWGVYTHFEHDEQRHQLMLCDSRSCHKPMKASGGNLPFVPLGGADRHDREHVSAWRAERRFRTGKFGTNDFDYMKPTANLKAEQQGSARYEKGMLESYDYPGRYTERDLGQRRSKVRLEAEQALDMRKYASGDAASLFPGALATLQNHPSDNGEYLVVRASHRIEPEAYRSGSGGGGDVYSGTYEFQPVDRPFRAPLVTRGPSCMDRRPRSSSPARAGRARRSMSTRRVGSSCSSTGTVTRTASPGPSASPSNGPANPGAGRSFRAWDKRSSSSSWKGTLTSLWWSARSTTRIIRTRSSFRTRRRSRA